MPPGTPPGSPADDDLDTVASSLHSAVPLTVRFREQLSARKQRVSQKLDLVREALDANVQTRRDEFRERHPGLAEAGERTAGQFRDARARFQELKYRRNISVNLPANAALGGDGDGGDGAGWFALSDGRPLTTRTRSGRFIVPWETRVTFKSAAQFLRWRWGHFWLPQGGHFHPGSEAEARALVAAEPAVPPPRPPPGSGGAATWLGHAAVLVAVPPPPGDPPLHVLTDPNFSARASPVSWAGPKRYANLAGGLGGAVVGEVAKAADLVLVSHDHYDHLDLPTLRALHREREKRSLPPSRYYVPLGTKAFLLSHLPLPPSCVTELAWWDAATHVSPSGAETTVTATPAQHWCSRTPFDRNERLWCGFAVAGPLAGEAGEGGGLGGKFYYAGDTGYPSAFPLFSLIGDRWASTRGRAREGEHARASTRGRAREGEHARAGTRGRAREGEHARAGTRGRAREGEHAKARI
jgi:L-ascorbate metabolism protein UlaG (beta-lactamase superfamily)